MTTLERGAEIASEIGLKVHTHSAITGYEAPGGGLVPPRDWYLAETMHRLLVEGLEVYSGENIFRAKEVWGVSQDLNMHTDKALLIAIRPIVQESREQKMEALLKEMLTFGMTEKSESFYARAEALLERSEGKQWE